MPPLSLPVEIQFGDITAKLETIQKDLDELEDLMTDLVNEREEYKTWILKNAYYLGLSEPDSFMYQQLQRRTNQWNIQFYATEEAIEDLKNRKDNFLQQQKELKDELSQLLQNK